MNRVYAFLICTCSLLAHFASAQTNVSGFINANTTWTLAGSPYIVTGNALLSQGFTLTIDPGVVVKFGTSNALQIDGQLIAIGTPTQRIVFTSNQSSPQAGDWAKLHFSDFSVNAVYNAQGNYVSGSIMKYCDVLYGGSAMYGALDIQQSSPYFNHCRIANSSWSGINFNGDSLHVDSSAIRNCTARGIIYQGGHFLFRNDSFTGNIQGAIHVMQMYDGVQSHILDSYFSTNYSALTWLNNGLSYVTIKGNIFTNHIAAVVELQGTYDTISCNRFINNTGGPAIHWGDGSNPISGGIIYNNLFQGNSSSFGPSVFRIGAGYNAGAGDTLIIAGNVVRNNSSQGYACCEIEADLFSSIPGPYLRIRDNEFTSNSGAQFMRIHGAQNNNPSYNFLRIVNNNFTNPNCQYELYNDVPYGSPNLAVGNNYWGSTSTTYVESVIYDYFDFPNQSVVYYAPVLTAPVGIDSTCQSFIDHPDGIHENNLLANAFLVYPNPASGQVTVTFTGVLDISDGATIEILNALSQVVYSTNITNASATTIALPEAGGVYFVRVTTEKGMSVERVVKE